jgi:hypothetical protein
MKTKQLLLTSAALVLSTTLAAYADDTSVSYIYLNTDTDSTGDNGVIIREGTGTTSPTTIATINSSGASFSGDLALQGNLYDSSDAIVNIADGLDVTGATDLNAGLNVDGATTLDATTIAGATSVTGATTINTSGTDASTIGANGNTTSILSSTVSIGTGAYGSTVAIGSTDAGTTVVATAGDASTVLAQDGDTRWVADANGQLVSTSDSTSGTTAALVVTNSANNTHGIVIEETKTTISGGLNSSSLTLDDLGATFSDSATGAPIQVHGVADGTADFDATNVRQVYSGLAAVLAATPELRLEPGKTGVGVGLGSYGGFNAVGIGFGHMYDNGAVLTGAVSKAPESEVAYKASVAWTW